MTKRSVIDNEMSKNYQYLNQEFPILYNLCQSAEYHLYSDSSIAVIKLRLFGEKLTDLLFDIHFLEKPYSDNFYNRINQLVSERIISHKLSSLFNTIRIKGNIGAHQNKATESDGLTSLLTAFKLSKWFVATYGEEDYSFVDGLRFSKPENLDTRHAINELQLKLDTQEKELERYKSQLKKLSKEQEKEIIEKSESSSRKMEMNEEETRTLIDEQLRLSGWKVDTVTFNYKKNKTIPKRGEKIAIAEWKVGRLWADYALFIDQKLYGIIEAKKYASDISTDLGQSKVYAKAVEENNDIKLLDEWRAYKVPFLFSTNGRPYLKQLDTKSGIWFLDVRKERNTSRSIRGWFSPDGLKKLYEQDVAGAEEKLKKRDIDFLQSPSGLGLRDYQIKAIKTIEQKLIEEPEVKRRLIAMATGTGKTRTIIGLCYRLISTNRFRRILFLVDRRLLAEQAFDSFQDNKVEELSTFSDIYHVSKLKEVLPETDTRLHFATVQSMVKRLYQNADENKHIPIDTYDCIIIDEAHRGYLLDKEMDDEELVFKDQDDYVSKYRMVIDYFDAHAIGLTATPALHTTQIFGLPAYSYSYREAVIDGWLIDYEPPFEIITKLSKEGIKWKKGEKPKALDVENNTIIELDELEDELQIEVEGFNKNVITESFNKAVLKQLAQNLDPEGEEKTLIFAARDEHADMVVEILKKEFEEMGAGVPDDAIVKITGQSYKPKDLLRKFKNEKYPNIAVTVDLLTTGIDVPSICNLVFLRRIRSRILYEQMLGRATRLCDEIGKESFHIYDAVKLYEALGDFTKMKPLSPNPKTTFVQLANETKEIQSAERMAKQVEQILAKFHRKKQLIKDDEVEKFEFNSKGKSTSEFIDQLRSVISGESEMKFEDYQSLWKYLDKLKPLKKYQLVSEHEDKVIAMEQKFGKYGKPEDYIEEFTKYVKENQNKISALNIICTKPDLLDRKSLKELKLKLDEEGFSSSLLNKAWKATKNVDIAASIISYIRTLSLGTSLISHEVRTKKALDKIRSQKDWNKIQLKWLDRIEKQLLAETVLQKDDLEQAPFEEAGGLKRLDKIFDNNIEGIIQQINDLLYKKPTG